jgi:hypothetical protein
MKRDWWALAGVVVILGMPVVVITTFWWTWTR